MEREEEGKEGCGREKQQRARGEHTGGTRHGAADLRVMAIAMARNSERTMRDMMITRQRFNYV